MGFSAVSDGAPVRTLGYSPPTGPVSAVRFGAYQQWPAVSVNDTWVELAPHSTFTVTASSPAHLTIATPLSLSPSSPASGTTLTGSFAVTNDGGTVADVQTLLVGARGQIMRLAE